jgi:HEAT repeat protein
MPQKKQTRPNTARELAAAMRSKDMHDRFAAMDAYRRGRPTADAVPVLRKALRDEWEAVVKCAAEALGKLGPTAADAVDDLLAAAVRIDDVSRMPQAYPECVRALAAIQPDHWELPTVIKTFIGLDNWVPIRASLEALKAIGTPESLDILRRAAAFWMPELNKMQRRVVQEIIANSPRSAKK